MSDQPLNITNNAGLSFWFLIDGTLNRIDGQSIRISIKPASTFSRSGPNIWIRKRSTQMEFHPLMGPESNARVSLSNNTFAIQGTFEGIEYHCHLQLSIREMAWYWTVTTKNTTGSPVELDLIYTQDVGLKQISDGLINEYYVSQYIERRVLEDEIFGSVVCCRQNNKEAGGNPWIMLACQNGATSASTDGMQFFGNSYRLTGIPEGLLSPELGGEMAGESSFVALHERPFSLQAGDQHTSHFVAIFLLDHPAATSSDDLKRLTPVMQEIDLHSEKNVEITFQKAVKDIFHTARFLPTEELNEQELVRYFGTERYHPEYYEGKLLSFFGKHHTHVVLRTKEGLVDRPHGHIMQANTAFTPHEGIMSTTAYASGIFNSHLSQGNTNFSVFLSISTSQFNLEPYAGQRIIVQIEGRQHLLGVPSAFEMGLNHCKWIYKTTRHCIQVRTWTNIHEPRVNIDFNVLHGEPVNIILTHTFDPLNRWEIQPGSTGGEFLAKPDPDGMLASKFPAAQFKMVIHGDALDIIEPASGLSYGNNRKEVEHIFALSKNNCSHFSMSFLGEVQKMAIRPSEATGEEAWQQETQQGEDLWKSLSLNLSLGGEEESLAAIRSILPWYGMDALIHYLTPYGLEQFSGAAWGTRDISQGPFDLLLCMERYSEARQLLRTLFSNQNPDGGWPQWWMFDSFSEIRADGAHGDVVYWCIIALCNYIKVTGDVAFLDELLPYYHKDGGGEQPSTPLSEHVDRVIQLITSSFIPNTSLVAFGGGDWNDSLQPVSKELANRMISSWTVEMNYQAFSELNQLYNLIGAYEKAESINLLVERIRDDFNKHLIRDGVVAGYGMVEENGEIGLLLHPADGITDIHYSILPMNRGIISGLFTEEQAFHHQPIIEQHLKGPDGARLMDRPLKYRGGIQTIFQRAESSTFFGREIGLMYVHEHIRYAESLARLGKAEAFLHALRQAIPIEYQKVVPSGDFRQTNCYYSSSDVTFKTRYEADERYPEVVSGAFPLKGGWRVYSSGPGIFISLIKTRLLGIRIEGGKVIFDPVLSPSLDGISASMTLLGKELLLKFHVSGIGYSPSEVIINGTPVEFTEEVNPYRKGGAVIHMEQLLELANLPVNRIEINLP